MAICRARFRRMERQRQLNFADERPDTAAVIAQIEQNRTPVSLLLDGVTDPQNVAMLLRLADGARLKTVYFHNCSLPTKRKLSAARSVMPFLQLVVLESEEELLNLHRENKFIAIEKTDKSIIFTAHHFEQNTVLIIGAESAGVSQKLLDLSATALHLPMLGINTSINLACAASVVVYRSLAFFV